MDGLGQSRKLKEQYPNIKIIIFSGFDEFEYAKEAIDIEVEQYLLKPVNAEELGRVFSRIREMLDHERDEQRNIDKLNQYYLESLPLLQESFYTSLIEGRVQPDEIEEVSGELSDSLGGSFLCNHSPSYQPVTASGWNIAISDGCFGQKACGGAVARAV